MGKLAHTLFPSFINFCPILRAVGLEYSIFQGLPIFQIHFLGLYFKSNLFLSSSKRAIQTPNTISLTEIETTKLLVTIFTCSARNSVTKVLSVKLKRKYLNPSAQLSPLSQAHQTYQLVVTLSRENFFFPSETFSNRNGILIGK